MNAQTQLTPSTATANLYTRLNREWGALCARPVSATAEAITWSATQPALAAIRSLADLADAHRADREGVLRALLVLHQDGSALAGRALMQLMLGKLISITRYARIPGHDRIHACDERAAVTVAAFMSVIAAYRPSGDTFVALSLRTLKEISAAATFDQELPDSDFVEQSLADDDDGGHFCAEEEVSAEGMLEWAVNKKVISIRDQRLLQIAYLDQADRELAQIARDLDISPAALRKRLSRALSRLRTAVVQANRRTEVAQVVGVRKQGVIR